MIRLEEIVDEILSYNSDADVDYVRKAYIFSAKVHLGQKRQSGEPYLSHPIEVAMILAHMRMDVVTIAAGLLHDTLEDTPTTPEELNEFFGPDLTYLVQALTKISKIQFKTKEAQQAENFRKMIIAMGRDIRVIVIKLADRLHNMRTLEHLRPAKQEAISQETQDIYAPLANRLGIGWMKSELEDLCFKYLKPDKYREIEQQVAKRREELEEYIRDLKKIVERSLKEQGYTADVKGRPKHFYSIYLKMDRQKVTFDEVYDLLALRIILPDNDKTACYGVLGLIHSLWPPVAGRFKDYISVPKSNLYQSLHTTVLGPKGERVEFQIRTEEMDKVAEEGIAAHWKYKEKSSIGEKDDQRFAWLRQLMESQQDIKDDREFLDTLRLDLFSDVVYVFTPRGDVREFPRGSTPIDFAYSIHSDIGDQCVGARVNGKIVPLRQELETGDVVEIQTQTGHNPSRDWLKHVKTAKAKTRIKHWLKIEEHRQSVELGQELLEKELRRHNLPTSKLTKPEELGRILPEFNCPSDEQLFAEIGSGKVSSLAVVRALAPETVKAEEKSEKSFFSKLIKKTAKTPEKGVKISGIDNVMIHYSKCCSPIPGDEIIGFITRGRGITIHAADCPNVTGVAFDRERMVKVDWEQAEQAKIKAYTARITVFTVDKPGILAKITSAITESEANINQAQVSALEGKKAVCNFSVEIDNREHLGRLMKRIDQLDGVLEVKRVMS
ncbi:MAG: bifunctional (p)ppGpp synthetase/guanosine-3',5'-bis(diphosphate) 3'-pyrophosphohydrolase [Nitrospirota bacterium]|nr:bifunctional (p)ppGpp synthetase/guanosine-3',5'-bis(diphosphate) 3'-pyrophosphohydrolase [Nitrospirota bacterium]